MQERGKDDESKVQQNNRDCIQLFNDDPFGSYHNDSPLLDALYLVKGKVGYLYLAAPVDTGDISLGKL